MNQKPFFLLTLLSVLFICSTAYAQGEEITLSTYYPAPYGEYEEMAAENLFCDKQIIGNMDVNGDGQFSTHDDIALVNGGNLLVEGRVGIGTTTPGAKLHIAATGGGGYTTNNVLVMQRTDVANYPTARIEFQGSTGAAGDRWQILGDADVGKDFGFSYNGAKMLQILNSGNVGIGTTGPNVKLDVRGAASSRVQMTLSDGNTASAMIRAGASTPAVFGSDVGINFRTGASWTDADSGGTTVMSLTTGGNVGIGTTNPQAKLDVSSTTSGFLPPRMTAAQRDSIASPPAGSVIYNTDENNLNLYNGSTWQGTGAWVKIAEVDLSSSGGYTFTGLDGNTQKMYKVIFQGSLVAGGTLRYILIRPNGSLSGYRSFAVYNGDAGGGVWNLTGFMAGHNGWSADGQFSCEYTINAVTGRRRLGFGIATYVHPNGSILGEQAHGQWDNTTTNITSLWFGPSGGTISGKLILLALQ